MCNDSRTRLCNKCQQNSVNQHTHRHAQAHTWRMEFIKQVLPRLLRPENLRGKSMRSNSPLPLLPRSGLVSCAVLYALLREVL